MPSVDPLAALEGVGERIAEARRLHAEAIHDLAIHAAAARQGGVSVARIMEAAGVARGTVYLALRSLDEG